MKTLFRRFCQGFVLCVCLVTTVSADGICELQTAAVRNKDFEWGHWGPDPTKYSSWTSHTNRLIPIYTFGIDLASVRGEQSLYRDAEKLRQLYGYLPEGTVNPRAEYFDQTDVYKLQKLAVERGKKFIVLFVFDGMDWQTTWAAAIAKSGEVRYQEGRGTGLHFQDYANAPTDFGYFVSSPQCDGTTANVDRQEIGNPGGNVRGGYHAESAGMTPWYVAADPQYLIGKGTEFQHAYADSAAAATSLTAGVKTYNDAINVDAFGRQVVPIARELQDRGFAVGAVTSVPISHATPACAYANNVHRDDYQDLTRDMVGRPSIAHPDSPLPGLDVVLGAGFGETKEKEASQGANFVPGNRYITAEDLAAIDVNHGGRYEIVQRTCGQSGREILARGTANAVAGKHRLFGMFGVASGHLPFRTADGKFDPTVSGASNAKSEVYSDSDVVEDPTLAEMSVAALDILAANSDRFWLMIEPGDVDWANHANNLDASIGAVLSGDEAFRAVTSWIEEKVGWDDSAVIVTADHGHYLVLDKPEILAEASRR